jgi:hypothetical protein
MFRQRTVGLEARCPQGLGQWRCLGFARLCQHKNTYRQRYGPYQTKEEFSVSTKHYLSVSSHLAPPDK